MAGTSPELMQPSTDLICGEPCTVYVKYTLASALVPLSGEIFAVSFSDFAVIPGYLRSVFDMYEGAPMLTVRRYTLTFRYLYFLIVGTFCISLAGISA